jgi:hypothetical protein
LQTDRDDVDLQFVGVIPEPVTWAMLLSGAGMLIVWQKGNEPEGFKDT